MFIGQVWANHHVMFDHIRVAGRVILLRNTLLLLMIVAFLPFATSVLAGALRSGRGLKVAVVCCGVAFDATALTFNAVWQYACRHQLLSKTLDATGAAAIGRRFQLARSRSACCVRPHVLCAICATQNSASLLDPHSCSST